MPESQASRAICITNVRRFTMVGAKDGSITIRHKSVNGEVIELQDTNQWIEVIESNADGSLFAVGSHDGKIYVYET
jgi:WD40 repeat protein